MSFFWGGFPCSCGGGSFRSGMQSPTGAGTTGLGRGAKRRFAGRIPKRRLGTTRKMGRLGTTGKRSLGTTGLFGIILFVDKMPASSLFSCLPGRARRVAGFCGSGEAFAVAQFLRGERGPVLFLARDALSAAHLAEEIPFFAPDVSVRLLPDWETLPYDAFAPPAEAVGARVKALSLLLDSAPGITIAAATAALGPFAPPRFVAAHAFELQVGGKVNLLGLAARLSLGGYARVEQVRAPGEFAVRGGQADVFPAGGRKPLRVVLFDDEVEEIRVFNPETQLSESRVESFRALPAREFDFSAEGVKVFQKEFGARFGDERGGGEILDKVRSGEAPPGAEYLIPLFFAEGAAARLFDYLPDNQRILTHDDARDGLESFLHQARLRQKVVSVYEGRPVIPAAELFLSLEDFFLAMKKFGALSLRGEDGCGPPPEVSDTGSVAELARRFSGETDTRRRRGGAAGNVEERLACREDSDGKHFGVCGGEGGGGFAGGCAAAVRVCVAG